MAIEVEVIKWRPYVISEEEEREEGERSVERRERYEVIRSFWLLCNE
jgi:hypothetical protein